MLNNYSRLVKPCVLVCLIGTLIWIICAQMASKSLPAKTDLISGGHDDTMLDLMRFTHLIKQEKPILLKSLVVKKNTPAYHYPEDELINPFVLDKLNATNREAQAIITTTKWNNALIPDKPISLNVDTISLRKVLKLLADYNHTNMVISDSVSGRITLKLNQVAWSQALDIILTTQGLAKREVGGIILIDTLANLIEKDNQADKAKQLEPIQSDLFQVVHAKASDIANIIKDKSNSLLSAQGSLSVDTKTNKLVLQDKASHLKQLKQLISRLDVPIQQVMIEARIVNLAKNSSRDLGIRLGLSNNASLSGVNQLAQGLPWSSIPLQERLNLDLAAAPIEATPASIGIALATLGNHALLDLELSALESQGRAKIVASPRLMTTNQQTAIIESGEDIPYQETTASGASSVSFRKAALSLKVTPQLTADGKLWMDLKINQDTDSGRRVQGVPIILTKSIKTNVLVNNGQTIVLGGIYKQGKHQAVDKLPLLGSVPGLGALLSRRQNGINNEELLIFITPKIIGSGITKPVD